MKKRLNDEDRREWLLNDESLYRWWKSSHQAMKAFIRENRVEIDKLINDILNREPA